MFGTGEYTTGFTAQGASVSDKKTGVVALVMLDLKRRKLVGRLGMVGTNGKKMPQIRAHMQAVLGDVYTDIDPSCIETFPADGVVDADAYLQAITQFAAGDVAIIFTPDDTHKKIALACLEHGLHVLLTKPPVKTLEEHLQLAEVARTKGVLCAVEVHKRYDPIYIDARDRIASLGPFSFFNAYMSQPKRQLDTFRAWAGRSSDISYYLNAHHIDFHVWCMRGDSRPERVTALCSDGVATGRLGVPTEDTITLAVNWRNKDDRHDAAACGGGSSADNESVKFKHCSSDGSAKGSGQRGSFAGGSCGHAVYTSSWIAPKSDVHSQQRWFYMGQRGEVIVDQAHRGYTIATDDDGYSAVNPLFWKPTRDAATGLFSGQRCYGYISFESFIAAASECAHGKAQASEFNQTLPTLETTVCATAILEAGRRSLDHGGQPMRLVYGDENSCIPLGIIPEATQEKEDSVGKRVRR